MILSKLFVAIHGNGLIKAHKVCVIQWDIVEKKGLFTHGFGITIPQPIYPHRSNMCCPRDCVSRHNGGTSGAPLKPLRVDSALRALSTLRGLRGAPEGPPLCRETQSLGQQMLELSCENATVGTNGLSVKDMNKAIFVDLLPFCYQICWHSVTKFKRICVARFGRSIFKL